MQNPPGSSFYNPNYLSQQPTRRPIGILMQNSRVIQGAIIIELQDPIAKGNAFVI